MILTRPDSKFYWIKLCMNGRIIRKSTKCEKKSEAIALHEAIKERYLADKRKVMVAHLFGETPPDRKKLPLSLVWAKYIIQNPQWSNSGRETFERFRKYCKMDYDISEITTDMALEWIEQYRDRPQGHNHYKSELHKIWKTIRPYTDIKANPWADIPNISVNPKRTRIFTNNEIRKILAHTSGFWHDAFLLGINTGLRLKDIFNLQWQSVKSTHIELIPAKTTANNRSVYIPLRPEAKAVINARKGQNKEYVFIEHNNYHVQRKRKGFNAILRKLKISAKGHERVGFHSCRSTFISKCEEQGISRQVVMGIVGHGSPAMTERYSHDLESAKSILKIKIT
jgi:integrase